MPAHAEKLLAGRASQYMDGERVEVKVNKLTSTVTQVTRHASNRITLPGQRLR